MTEFNVDSVKQVVDRSVKPYITDSFIDLVNGAIQDSEIADEIKDNMISYTSVLVEGKYKLTDYVNAVKFVSYKLLGKSSVQAYILTFPDRYERLMKEEVKDVSPHACMYAKGKLVNAIMEQTLVPSYVLNQPMYQEALNVSYEIMTDERQKGLVRVKAAEIILNHTKQPEKTQISLDINNNNNSIEDMRIALTEMAKLQKNVLLSSDTSLRTIIESPIIESEAIEG